VAVAALRARSVHLAAPSTWALVVGHHPRHSTLGIAWTAVTAGAMAVLAAAKARTGRLLGNPVLVTEGRVTAVDALLAVAVLLGLTLDAAGGWWWADPVAGYVLVAYAVREARAILLPPARRPPLP
jgi:divalent metal cation (Fe/Co/Zn/Cd) transporter